MMLFDADFMTRDGFPHRFFCVAAMQQEGANARGAGLIAQDW
jgi:hypothetical protein